MRGFSSSLIPSCAGLADLDLQLTLETLLAQAVEANVRWSMRQILETPEGRERQAEGRLKLVGAIYEIETGREHFLDGASAQEPPRIVWRFTLCRTRRIVPQVGAGAACRSA